MAGTRKEGILQVNTEGGAGTAVDINFPLNPGGTRVLVELPAGGGGLTDAELRAIPVNIEAVDLDTRNLAFATDKVDASGSTVSVSNFPATQPVSGSVSVSNLPATQPISAVALPLPAGAATAANQLPDGHNVAVSNFPPTQTIAGLVFTKSPLTPSAPATVSVGITSGIAVAAEVDRRGLILRNLSSARISLGFDNPAVLDSGVTLYPRDVFNMNEYDFHYNVINAIASAAASPLAIQEYLM